MNYKSLLSSAAVILALSTLGFANAVTAVSSSISLQMTSNAGCSNVVRTGNDSQGATINSLFAEVTDLAVCVAPLRTVRTQGAVLAHWQNDSAGSALFLDVGWTTRNVTSGSAFADQGLDYSYTFTANVPAHFVLAYGVEGNDVNNNFGLNGFWISLNGDGQFVNVDDSGLIQWNLLAGNNYTLLIKNLANISGSFGTIDREFMQGLFVFRTVPTPEPASLILLGSGLVGAFTMARKKLNR